MSDLTALLAILGAVLIGAMSPGPSFLLVSRAAIAHSRRHAVASAVGMGLGGAVFSCVAMGGLATVLLHWNELYAVLKCVGGAYLCFLAYRIWRSAAAGLEVEVEQRVHMPSVWRSLLAAMGTQLANPKTAIVYGAIFAALLPSNAPMLLLWTLPVLVFFVEASWYMIIAVALSTDAPRAVYLRWKALIDRCASAVLGIIGGKLIQEGLLRQ